MKDCRTILKGYYGKIVNIKNATHEKNNENGGVFNEYLKKNNAHGGFFMDYLMNHLEKKKKKKKTKTIFIISVFS